MSKAELPRFHESANIFPMMSEQSFEAFLNDVRVKGILKPVVIWRDEHGREFILDGRNRAMAWKRLTEEGHEIEGKPISLPRVEFHGDEAAALSYVISCNMHRRDLSSSQRAAVAIKANMLAASYQAKQDPDNPHAVSGDIATQIANLTGTNRTYIFRCQRIAQYSPDLLQQVVDGLLSIPQALAKMKEAAGSHVSAEDDAEQVVEEKAVLDGLKEPVPPEWEKVFIERDSYIEVVRNLRVVRNQVLLLSEGPARHWLEDAEVLSWLNNAMRSLAAAKPHAICPECVGEKKVEVPGKKKRQRCERCEGRGYLNRARYVGTTTMATPVQELPPELPPEPETGSDVGHIDVSDSEPSREPEASSHPRPAHAAGSVSGAVGAAIASVGL